MCIIVSVTSFMRDVVHRRDEAIGWWRSWIQEDPMVHPQSGFVQVWFPQLHLSSVSPILRLVVLGCLLIQRKLMRNSERLGFPTFAALGKGTPALRNSIVRLRGGCRFYLKSTCTWLTGQMLAGVVQRKGATAGSLDGWGWRKLKVLPVSWYDKLARILTKVEDLGVWPDGLLDAYIAMIPKTDGDATALGQRPICVLPIVHRIWASARMGQLDGWFKSGVPDSVFSTGGGRGSVEAWYTSFLDIEEVRTGATNLIFISLSLMCLSLLIRLTGGFWIGSWASWLVSSCLF